MRGGRNEKLYHLQIVRVLEPKATALAIVPVVSLVLHMLVRCALRVEFTATRFA
jgi:hypothetical protein